MKRISALILALLTALSLCACGNSEAPVNTEAPAVTGAEGPVYDTAELKYSINGTSTSIEAQVAELFKEKIEAATNGSITVTIFTDAQLAGGDLSGSVEAAQTGVMDIFCADGGVISALNPSLAAYMIPFSFGSYEDVDAVFTTTAADYISGILKDYDLTYAAYAHNGLQCLTCSKVQLDDPENFKDIKIRISGSQLNIDTYTALGADPSALNWGEVYTALQNGTFDAQSNSPATIKSGNIQEVQDYIAVTRHMYGAFLISFYSPTFDSFSADTQDLLMNTLQEAAAEINAKVAAEEDSILKGFEEEGMTVSYLSEEQIAEFKAALADVITKYKDEYGAAACEAYQIP